MSYSPDIPGISGNYAPADFGSAEESAPTAVIFDIGGNGQPNPYSIAIGGMINKQLEEIRGKAVTAVNLSSMWKRRFREFMSKKNSDLLEFLKVEVKDHPVLGRGDMLLRRFGNPNGTSNNAVVRDMVMDASGGTYLEEIDEALKAVSGSGPLKDLGTHVAILYEQYKDAGDAAFTAQASLKVKLDRLDKLQGKLANLFEIDVNDKYEQLMAANEEYMKKIFDDANISAEYLAMIESYRKFITLRETIMMIRAFSAFEKQPVCSICLEDSVSYALNPCGHTFCQTCIRKHTSNACFICRSHVKDKIKLYFG